MPRLYVIDHMREHDIADKKSVLHVILELHEQSYEKLVIDSRAGKQKVQLLPQAVPPDN